MVRVDRVTVELHRLTAAGFPALKEVTGLAALPLCQAQIGIELSDCPLSIANALRRTATDEMPGFALTVPEDGYDVSHENYDVFMLPRFVSDRIHLIPLRPHIAPEVIKNLTFSLDVTNDDLIDLHIYAADLVSAPPLTEPIFNPTFKLAVIKPGKRIVIRGIRVTSRYGRDDAAYNVARRAALTHLDLEQHTDDEMRRAGSAVADLSGYKASCLVSNPRRHRVSAWLPAVGAVSEVAPVFADCCAVLQERLRRVAAVVERGARAKPGAEVEGIHSSVYTVSRLQNGLFVCKLIVADETHTIGEMLARAAYTALPNLAFVKYAADEHKNALEFNLHCAEDATDTILKLVRGLIGTFEAIQVGITASAPR